MAEYGALNASRNVLMNFSRAPAPKRDRSIGMISIVVYSVTNSPSVPDLFALTTGPSPLSRGLFREYGVAVFIRPSHGNVVPSGGPVLAILSCLHATSRACCPDDLS